MYEWIDSIGTCFAVGCEGFITVIKYLTMILVFISIVIRLMIIFPTAIEQWSKLKEKFKKEPK